MRFIYIYDVCLKYPYNTTYFTIFIYKFLWYFLEHEKSAEFAKSSEKDEKMAEKENAQSTLSAVPTETKGEVTLDSKTGKINCHPSCFFPCNSIGWKLICDFEIKCSRFPYPVSTCIQYVLIFMQLVYSVLYSFKFLNTGNMNWL